MTINVAKIVGRVDGQYWAQVHDFSHDIRGRLLAIITLKKKEEETEVTIVSKGREILSHLHELYFGQTEKPAYEQLLFAVQALIDEDPTIFLTCAVIINDDLYLVSTGGGIWIREQSKEGFLLKPQIDSEIAKLCGKLRPQMQIIIGNNLFWQNIPAGVVRAALESDLEQAVETLGAVAHGSQKAQGVAGILINIQPPVEKPKFVVLQEEMSEEIAPTVSKFDWLAQKLPKKAGPVFVQYGTPKSSKTLIFGIIFLVAFGILAIVGRARYQYLVSGREKLDQRSEELAFKYNEAKALLVLNPVRSRQLLAEIKTDFEDIQVKGGAKYKNTNLDTVARDLAETLDRSQGINKVIPTEVLDLGLIRDGMTATRMAWQEDHLLVLDTVGSRLVSVDPVKKSGKVIVGKDQIGIPKLLSSYPGKTEILTDIGIIECQNDKCQNKIKSDPEWGTVVDMGMFAGNIYLLTKDMIWRYQTTETGFGTKQAWLSKTEKVDLSGSTTLTIDGSLWVTSGSEIFKFTRGIRENFFVSDLTTPLSNNLIAYTNEDIEKIYILDKVNKRVVALKKTGEFVAQYTSDSMHLVTALVADEKNGKIYLLTGAKIMQIDL